MKWLWIGILQRLSPCVAPGSIACDRPSLFTTAAPMPSVWHAAELSSDPMGMSWGTSPASWGWFLREGALCPGAPPLLCWEWSLKQRALWPKTGNCIKDSVVLFVTCKVHSPTVTCSETRDDQLWHKNTESSKTKLQYNQCFFKKIRNSKVMLVIRDKRSDMCNLAAVKCLVHE